MDPEDADHADGDHAAAVDGAAVNGAAVGRADGEQVAVADGTQAPSPRPAGAQKLTVVNGAHTAPRPVPRRRGPRGARRPVTTAGRPFAKDDNEGEPASDAREADLP